MKTIFSFLTIFFVTAVSAQNLRLWYRQPAQIWTEALPIGNGDLGAMIFGGVEEDHLQLNVSTFWTGQPRSYQRADAGQYLDTIRKLLFAGRQAEAETLAQAHFIGRRFPDEEAYEGGKRIWFDKVRSDTTYIKANSKEWLTMSIPTPNGWETAGLEGVDGAIWFRTSFDLPEGWKGEDVKLELGRIRDEDFTYVNGVFIGTDQGISKKRQYIVKGSFLKPKGNVINIKVLNYDDKGGLIGIKGSPDLYVTIGGKKMGLPHRWSYKIQDQNPPGLPKYEAEYQPFGDLLLQFPGVHGANYSRTLDLETAIATTAYMANGVHYKREYLASVPDKAILIH